LHSFAIITTRANGLCAELHDRMSVILSPQSWPAWLGKEPAHPARLKAMLAPYPSEEMTGSPVNVRVGSAKNNDPSLIEQIAVGYDRSLQNQVL
jgi:putative SOS response-associated peptidase YedK